MINLNNNKPTLDLHGELRQTAVIKINDFIEENYYMQKRSVVIVHGKGSGVLKKVVFDVLSDNKYVLDYRLDIFNDGQTLVSLKSREV